MADNIDNIIIEHLKAIRAEIADVKNDTADIKQRLHSIDTSVIDLRRNDVHIYEDSARQQISLDKLLERIKRIEKRLELS
jgi:ribosomal silencing factor RsfS